MENVLLVAVQLANGQGLDQPGMVRDMLVEHEIVVPGDLGALPRLVRQALEQLVDGVSPDAVNTLLKRYPPEMPLSDHDGTLHVHYARNGAPAPAWVGRLVAAKLALVAAGDPSVSLGRCAAAGCGNFFV